MIPPPTPGALPKRAKSARVVRRELKRLRAFIESHDVPCLESHVAYAIETAIRWAREETYGWPLPVADAVATAELIRNELAKEAKR